MKRLAMALVVVAMGASCASDPVSDDSSFELESVPDGPTTNQAQEHNYDQSETPCPTGGPIMQLPPTPWSCTAKCYGSLTDAGYQFMVVEQTGTPFVQLCGNRPDTNNNRAEITAESTNVNKAQARADAQTACALNRSNWTWTSDHPDRPGSVHPYQTSPAYCVPEAGSTTTVTCHQ